MRRTALALCLPLLALAGCGDSKSDGVGTTAPVSDGVGTKPSVVLPAEPPTELVITDLVEGAGPEAATGDSVVVHYVGVLSADGTEFDNSYDRGEPFELVLGEGRVIQGWEQGLIGVQQGTRRQLDIPADLAYGDTGSGDVIKPGAAITFVVDVVAVLPTSSAADQPDISVAPADNSTELAYTELIVGDGVSPTEGTTFAVRIIAYRADTGELLTSSWGSAPATFLFGEGTDSFPGLVAAVDGMKVGGRRQAQIPFTQMFNGQGNEELGLPAEVDLTVVLDLVAVY
jgi:peptidylprolyl isomerase